MKRPPTQTFEPTWINARTAPSTPYAFVGVVLGRALATPAVSAVTDRTTAAMADAVHFIEVPGSIGEDALMRTTSI